MNRLYALIATVLILAACSKDDAISTPVITVAADKVVFSIHAEGELEAVKSTPITTPTASRRPQTLAWIKPQFAPVKEGEVVAKFDGSDFQLEVDETEFEIQKLI